MKRGTGRIVSGAGDLGESWLLLRVMEAELSTGGLPLLS